MKEKIVHLPNSELELMMIIWEAGEPVSRVYIDEKLEGKQSWSATTVLNLLSRLADKGFVKVEPAPQGRMNLYSALIGEKEYIEFESKSLFGRFCSRSFGHLVANLYKNNNLTDDDIEELRQFIEEKGREKK